MLLTSKCTPFNLLPSHLCCPHIRLLPCLQCEAEGFRGITYFLDRPDVMARYTIRIEADKAKYPVLLSNGNLKEEGQLEGGRHFAVWEVREQQWATASDRPCADMATSCVKTRLDVEGRVRHPPALALSTNAAPVLDVTGSGSSVQALLESVCCTSAFPGAAVCISRLCVVVEQYGKGRRILGQSHIRGSKYKGGKICITKCSLLTPLPLFWGEYLLVVWLLGRCSDTTAPCHPALHGGSWATLSSLPLVLSWCKS